MLPLNRLIKDGLRHYHLEHGVKAKQSVSLWERVAGPTISAVTRADEIRDGILFVHTRSSAWSQELSLLREPLIARINAELEHEAVKDIRFQVKRIRKSTAEATDTSSAVRELSGDERTAIADLTASLDTDVAAPMVRVMEQQMRQATVGKVCPGCGGPLHGDEPRCPFCR